MNADYFISDFEFNIPKAFSKYFPEIETCGCYFHFTKGKTLFMNIVILVFPKEENIKNRNPNQILEKVIVCMG